MSPEEVKAKYNFRTTWVFRLPTLLAATALVAIGVSTAMLASRGGTGGHHGWWSEGNDFPVTNGTLRYLSNADEDLGDAVNISWWGTVYALPPGVRRRGGQIILAAVAISAGFGGAGLFVAGLFLDKTRPSWWSDFWRVYFAVPVLVSLVALVYSFAERYTTSSLDLDAFLAAGPRPRPNSIFSLEPAFTTDGKHSVESWSCAIRPLIELTRSPGPRSPPTPNGYTIYIGDDNHCNAAMIARWLTVPMFVFAMVLWLIVMMYPFWGPSSVQRQAQM